MTRVELVMAKSAAVRRRLERIADALSVGRDAFMGDLARVERAAFNVFLAMQECVDIGAHIVADERWGAPATLGEIFDLLGLATWVAVRPWAAAIYAYVLPSAFSRMSVRTSWSATTSPMRRSSASPSSSAEVSELRGS